MIHSLRRTKWLALVKTTPLQFSSVPSSERLRALSTLVSAQDSRKSSFSIPGLSGSAIKSDVGRLQSSKNPELVLNFLKDYGFSASQIKSVVSRWPPILASNPEKILKPKLDFLLSKGMSKLDLMRMISEEPKALTRSLENYLMPLFEFLEDAVGSEENAARAVRNFSCAIKSLELNTKKLHDAGVPKGRIAKLISHRPRAIATPPSRFEEALTMVREMGFEPADVKFGIAIEAIGWCSEPAWEGKMNLFRSYGLSDSEILAGFKRQPMMMILGEENVKAKMDFFLKSMRWCPSKLMGTPYVMLLSLEKRIIPRLSVLYLLVSRGEVKEKTIYSEISLLKMTGSNFMKNFVTPYRVRVPQVLDAHEGTLKIEDLHRLHAKAVFNVNKLWSGA